MTNPGVAVSVREEEHPGGRAYVHPPSNDWILGGTLEVGSYNTHPDPCETTAILKRCTDIAPALTGTRVLEAVVGPAIGKARGSRGAR